MSRVQVIIGKLAEIDAQLESTDTEVRVKRAARDMEKLHVVSSLRWAGDVGGYRKRNDEREAAARQELRLQELRGHVPP